MKGFFKVAENVVTVKAEKPLSTEPNCSKCKLDKHCLSPRMKCTGKGKKRIMIIAEAPGKHEDEQGIQFVGQAGGVLRKTCKELGVDIDLDCIKINAINCRPPKNRPPKKKEIIHCRPYVVSQIRKHKPNVIILLGKTAVESVIGYRWKKELGGIAKWRGWRIPEHFYNAWVCPTFHPSYLLHNRNEDVELFFKKDLKRAFALSDTPVPSPVDYNKMVRCVFSKRRIIKIIKRFIRAKKPTAIDYETTGKKPQRKGHDIVSCALCNSNKRAYAFPLSSNLIRKWLVRFLKNKGVPKIAQNIKFEEIWSRIILKTKIKNWFRDTMLTAHILDNRPGITGLKFQVYVMFGVSDYDSHIEKFLSSVDEKDSNSLNRIKKVPMVQLLLYNGLDSLFEKLIQEIQEKRIQ